MAKAVVFLTVLLLSSSSLSKAQSIDSIVRGEATASSGSISQLKRSVAEAVTEAVATSCTGDITAVGQALAVAVANASATAWAKAKARVEVVGSGKGCAAAKSTATAVATAVAEATASSIATASNGCEDGAVAQGMANSTKSAIATAIAEASAAACSTGGVAEATAKAVARAVVSVTASAYVEMIAKIRGKCDLCPEDEPADSPAPLHGEPLPPAEPSPKPADATNPPTADITRTITGVPSPASPSPSPQVAILVAPPSSPSPSPQVAILVAPPSVLLPNSPSPAKGDGKSNGKGKPSGQDKKISPAPASSTPSTMAPTASKSKYKQCDKSMQTNGCCGGKGFDAKGWNLTVCQCMEFNGRRIGETCRFARVINSQSTEFLWKDKFGGSICHC